MCLGPADMGPPNHWKPEMRAYRRPTSCKQTFPVVQQSNRGQIASLVVASPKTAPGVASFPHAAERIGAAFVCHDTAVLLLLPSCCFLEGAHGLIRLWAPPRRARTESGPAQRVFLARRGATVWEVGLTGSLAYQLSG